MPSLRRILHVVLSTQTLPVVYLLHESGFKTRQNSEELTPDDVACRSLDAGVFSACEDLRSTVEGNVLRRCVTLYSILSKESSTVTECGLPSPDPASRPTRRRSRCGDALPPSRGHGPSRQRLIRFMIILGAYGQEFTDEELEKVCQGLRTSAGRG